MSEPRDGRTSDAVARVRVTIDGEVYGLRSPEGAEHVQRCAALVDARIREVRAQGAGVEPPHRVALLAALSLAHDLLAQREDDANGDSEEGETLEALRLGLEALVHRVESGLGD